MMKLSEEGTFWLGVWVIIGIVVVTTVSLVLDYHTEQDGIIATAIEAGADPIELRCALSDSLGNNPSCIVKAMGAE